MGLNNTFIIRFPAQKKNLVADYLNANALFDYPGSFEKQDTASGSLQLLVRPDRFIRRYFREFYHSPFEARRQRMEDFMADGQRVRIGMVDFSVRPATPDRFIFTLTCVTDDMSLMFNDSPGIRQWLVELCRAGAADTGIYCKENDCYELVWWDQAERTMRLDDSIWNRPDTLLILSDFFPLAFDSWYNAIDE